MKDIPGLFGSLVFNDSVMQSKLPKDIYKTLKKTMAQGSHLEGEIANIVANAMKEWAVENGATHFTHWFQPLTGVTAEKHDSFISPSAGGKIIMEFSGKELIKGEPDASSFPSGGLRTTFEARGYTAWDPTSYAFIKDGTLCIPTAFCSYGGEALDKKTPLLRSMQAINTQALRILKLFGKTDVKRVVTTVGAEQEYFLIDKNIFLKRPDLIYTGRTLFGSRPPKGQELDDHFFGAIKPRVSSFMKELDEELWKLGILAKTKHNETAPSQHELAPIFSTTNIATDHNQLIMELMKSMANKHGLACLLHEKPFAGINGSGKHNNWSISTDSGINLLEPGENPFDNAQFLLFLVAVIKAADEYQDLLRISSASAGNDNRLGSNEAPPAIVSMFLGDELTEILKAIENDREYEGKEKIKMEIGASVLPDFPKDSTDRNRTSPFAFTGNKFEFRMVGSAFSIADINTVLNTAVAEVLSGFADTLEKSGNENEEEFKSDLSRIIKDAIKEHKRIIFNGNNYADEWEKESEERGLSNLKTTVEALAKLIDEKNVKLFAKHNVFNETELRSRYEILLENYCKTINIEAFTMVDMVKNSIIPSSINYQNEIADLINKKKSLEKYIDDGVPSFSAAVEIKLLGMLASVTGMIFNKLEELEDALHKIKSDFNFGEGGALTLAQFYRNTIFNIMCELRVSVDQLETIIAKKYWNFPTYAEILYSVN